MKRIHEQERYVPPYCIPLINCVLQILEQLEEIMNPAASFKAYRARLQSCQPPCIPFLYALPPPQPPNFKSPFVFIYVFLLIGECI